MATELKFCDIGVNLTDPVFRGKYRGKRKHDDDFDAMLDRARSAGVDKMIVTAGCLKEARQALEMAKAHDGLYSTVGVHPTRASEFGDDEEKAEAHLAALIEVAREGKALGKVVAAGEMGLDWDRTHFCPKPTQLENFQRQFRLVEAVDLPMFLHDRNTETTFLDIMKTNRDRLPRGGVVHSFTGSMDEMKALLELGFSIGINGCSLKTEDNLAVAAAVPLDRLMLETDAPWCEIRRTHAGHKHVTTTWPAKKPERWVAGETVKGRCEPCHIRQVAEVLAGIREESLEELVGACYENTEAMFFPSSGK